MNCTKDFQIKIAAPTYNGLYWPFDEPTGNRIDSAQGVILSPVGAGLYKDGPGHVGNCWQSDFANEFQATGLDMSAGGAITALGNSGQSVSLWGWSQNVAATTEVANRITFHQNNSAIFGDTAGFWSIILDTLTGVAQMATNTAPAITLPIADFTQWNFIVGLWDAATNRCGISVNGSAVSWGAAGGAMLNRAWGTIDYFIVPGGVAPIPQGGFDEVGVLPTQLLTDPQIAYLYNAGAGRTWPIVLP